MVSSKVVAGVDGGGRMEDDGEQKKRSEKERKKGKNVGGGCYRLTIFHCFFIILDLGLGHRPPMPSQSHPNPSPSFIHPTVVSFDRQTDRETHRQTRSWNWKVMEAGMLPRSVCQSSRGVHEGGEDVDVRM